MTNVITSSIVESQLPGYVQEDYPKFVTFLEKYYEWLETNNQLSNALENFSKSKDLDESSDFYLNLLKKELIPYFPEEILLDKSKLLKFTNQYYKSKGTPDSLKFLFKILYNEDVDIFYPKEEILIASDGKWALPLALRIDTNDNNIFNLVGVQIVGELSKATAVVESVTRSIDRQLGIEYVEIYISNIKKLFQTGETITGKYFDDDLNEITVTGRLIGSLSEIKIDPRYRGLFYNAFDTETGYEGDPVTIIGGLNPLPPSGLTPIGALATVGETTKGSIIEVSVIDGGFGFREPSIEDSSLIDFTGGFSGAVLGQESAATIKLVDQSKFRTLNVSNVSIETIYSLTLDQLSNANIDVANSSYSSNIENCVINLVTTKQTLNVFPISFVETDGTGGGYRNLPDAVFYSFYMEEMSDILVMSSSVAVRDTNILSDFDQDLTLSFESGDYVRLYLKNRFEEIRRIKDVFTNFIRLEGPNFENDIAGLSVYKILRRPITDVGSLGRIEIVDGGEDYNVGDYLIFTGGSGYGANAQISEVHLSNNGIKSVTFNESEKLIKGGEGYQQDSLPTITINSTTGSNSNLYVKEILGKGVDVDIFTTRIGSITKLRIVSYGYDYIQSPTISLRNADLVVSNVTPGQLFVSNTIIYQGASLSTANFSATVEKYVPSTGFLRIFNYKGTLTDGLQISSNTTPVVTANVVSQKYYGDGKARATANFENGLIRYPGIYLNTDGHLSADKKFQDDTKYHNYSYLISTQNDYNKFKKSINEILHPLGTKTFVNRINANEEQLTNTDITVITLTKKTLSNTFNIVAGSNNMVAVGSSPNLSATVNVGDMVILTSLYKSTNGTVNVTSSSNVITGNNTTFINDFQDGDSIYISSGNTTTIKTITNSTSLIVNTTINVSETNKTINLIFDSVKTVTFVNANTILVSGTFEVSSNLVTTIHQKIE